MNSTSEKGDERIMQAMKLLANVLREARREAGESTVSAARKTELEAWIEGHEAEIDARITVSEAHGNAIASRETCGKH